jgi:polyphosphate kinase
LEITLQDTIKVRTQEKDGSYRKLDKRGKDLVESQRIFYEQARKTVKMLELDERQSME